MTRSDKPVLKFRRLTVADRPKCLELFRDTVRLVNCRDYSPEQIAAWSSNEADADAWFARFDGNCAVVAELDGRLAGFADIAPDGYIDRFFVSAAFQRQGVGRGLMEHLLAAAGDFGCELVHTRVSITARPFFESQGFELVETEQVECRGQWLTSHRMQRRSLDSRTC